MIESLDSWQKRWLVELEAMTDCLGRVFHIVEVPDHLLSGDARTYLVEQARTGAPVTAYCTGRHWSVWVHGSRIEAATFQARYADATIRPPLEQLVELTRRHLTASMHIAPLESGSWRLTIHGFDGASASYDSEEPSVGLAYSHALREVQRMLAHADGSNASV